MKRQRWLLDSEWRFHKGDIALPVPKWQGDTYQWCKTGNQQGVPHAAFDDNAWRVVDLPHDWAVEGPIDQENNLANGFLPKGVAWYRRRFRLDETDADAGYYLEFDGIFRNATVWLNGHRLGAEPGGYISFRFDVSDVINREGTNTLAVRVDASEFEGWWYEGAGIYRHVWLVTVPGVHVAPWGVYVAPSFARGDLSKSVVNLETTVSNRGREPVMADIVSTLLDPKGKPVVAVRSRQRLTAETDAVVRQKAPVRSPRLWSLEQPTLYTVQTEIRLNGKQADSVETRFGFRHIRFDADQGFFLNHEPVKLQGTCNHQDHAGVGIAVPDAIQEYRIRKLKEIGCNAFRCAHNPPAPELLDACDRLGMLVMDETRRMESTTDGLRQLGAMILRDRNHPSIILWSMGNEEPLQSQPEGARIVRSMIRHARRLDATRPFTFAMSGGWGKEFSAELEVQGCNYGIVNIDQYHADHPRHPMVMSENSASVFTRGIYETDQARGLESAYDVNSPKWWNTTTETVWKTIAERPFMSGSFTWTGFDYRGEPQPCEWPCISSHFGILDTCGFSKDIAAYYRSWWGTRPVLHVFPHWNWAGREGQPVSVWCYSNCEEVELQLNGRVLGRQAVPRWGHVEWSVPYEPGTLTATGFRRGKAVMQSVRETTGVPVSVHLIPDRPVIRGDGEDVVMVRVEVMDERGRLVPTADNRIEFTAKGPGCIIGVGNGNPICHEPDVATGRSAFGGLCAVFVRAGRGEGTLTVEASSMGLAGGAASIRVVHRRPRAFLPAVPMDTPQAG